MKVKSKSPEAPTPGRNQNFGGGNMKNSSVGTSLKIITDKTELRKLSIDELDRLHQQLRDPEHRELRELVGEVVFEKVEKQVEERRIRNGYYKN